MVTITICPSCGSKRIHKVQREWTAESNGQPYTVPSLEFHQGPVCGEKVYDRQAMRKIESCSPAYAEAYVDDVPAAAGI